MLTRTLMDYGAKNYAGYQKKTKILPILKRVKVSPSKLRMTKILPVSLESEILRVQHKSQ